MAVLGNNIFISVSEDGVARIIAGTRTNEIKTTTDTIPISSIYGGKWKENLSGRSGWSISTGFLVLENEEVKNLLKVGRTIQVSVVSRDGDNVTVEAAGNAIITEMNMSFGVGKLAQGNCAFLGTGPLVDPNEDEVPDVPTIPGAPILPPSSGGSTTSAFKRGIVEQTQTWTKAADGGYDYAMSNLVEGDIPIANIDLFVASGAVFNEETGYFELNGLVDISYKEMLKIWLTCRLDNAARKTSNYLQGTKARTNICTYTEVHTASINLRQTIGYSEMESFNYGNLLVNGTKKLPSTASWFDVNAYRLKYFLPYGLDASGMTNTANMFTGSTTLTEMRWSGLKVNLSLGKTPRFSAESVAYLIENAGTSVITITLHPTAYARAIADASVQAALEAHTNVTLASA